MPRAAVRLLHARLPDHDHGRPARQPRAHRGGGARHDRRQPVPLHRLREHREVRPARLGDREGRVSTKLFGEKVQRVEDQRFLRGKGRYVDDVLVGHGDECSTPPSCARRTPTRGSSTSTSPPSSTSRACTWSGRTRTSARWPADGEPLPLLIPHPTLTHGRTQYALAKDEVNYVGEAIAFVVADDRYLAEDAVGRIRVDYEFLPAGRRHRRGPGRGAPRPRRRARQRRRPHGAGERRRPGRDRGRAAHPQPRPDHRAERLHADGGPGHRRPLGPRHRPAARSGRRPRPRPASGRPSRPSSASTSRRST